MSRQLLGVALTTALAVTLTGCGSGGSGSGDEALEIWIRQPPESASARTAAKLAEGFTKASGIRTKVVAIFDDFETKLQQQAAQRRLPDIVINDTAQLGNMNTQGWIREVDKARIAGGDQLSDLAWQAALGSDGKHYAVPFSAQSFALVVRRDWREKVGMEPPATWADLARLAKAFTDGDPDGNGRKDTSGFVIPAGTKRGYASWYAASLIHANGGDFVKAGGGGRFASTVSDPRTVEAVQYLQDQFCTSRTVNPGAVSNDTTVTHEVFEKGQGGIYLTGPWMLARFVKSLGTDRIEVLPVPKGPSGGPGTLGEGENVYLMAGSGNEAGQQRFAEYAASPDGQRIGMNKDADGAIVRLPVNSRVDLAAERQDPRWKVFQDSYAHAVYAPPVPNWAPIRQTSADTINAVWADCSADVKAAMADLHTKLTAELQSQKAS
ncbi:sugar ABC transporter substrate-binding protein [Nonomuraea indica]|uniref:Extracellular solute-binding protein n=1 Tax=Nonomuraea indica TaxID=1581193 RepID=A0ABW8AB46_9ACTN|nr:sugar ABC transporter substrate-binding protein [Nonomuraea indica]